MQGQQEAANSPVTIFYSYAHEDEKLRTRLEKHLSLLRRQRMIAEWHDRKIVPGTDRAQTIDEHLTAASVILLLISPDFLAGLLNGGLACIRHGVLRWLLWRSGCIPWNYVRFLDVAAERILLRKVGGGYIFVHRLLLDYFASLDTLTGV